MNKASITNTLQPTISYWTNNYHGLEAIINPFNMLMGIVVYFAARTLGLLYIIMQIDFKPLTEKAKNQIKIFNIKHLAYATRAIPKRYFTFAVQPTELVKQM